MDCLTTSFLEEEVTLADTWPDVKIEVQTLMSQFFSYLKWCQSAEELLT